MGNVVPPNVVASTWGPKTEDRDARYLPNVGSAMPTTKSPAIILVRVDELA